MGAEARSVSASHHGSRLTCRKGLPDHWAVMRDAAPTLELLPGQREALEVIARSTSAAYR